MANIVVKIFKILIYKEEFGKKSFDFDINFNMNDYLPYWLPPSVEIGPSKLELWVQISSIGGNHYGR